MKLSHLLLLPCLLAGCKSQAWTTAVVDDGAGNDVGGALSMHYHRDGQNKKLVLVYHDATAQRVRVATRTGLGANWDPFVVDTIASTTDAHDPVSSMGPDGEVYVAFGQPDQTSSDRTWRVYVATPTGAGGAWQTDRIDVPANQPELRKTNDPPAIAFQNAKDGPGHVYVVWSAVESRALVRASRALDDVEWFVSLISDEHEGRRPALLPTEDFERMLLFYGDTETGQGSPLVVAGSNPFGWGAPLAVGSSLAATQARFHAKFIRSQNSPDFGHIGVAHAKCDGKPRLRVSSDTGGSQFPTSIVPGIPTDPDRDFCEASFAYDFQGRPYISAFDADTESCIVFHVDPGPNQWVGEHIEAVGSDAGHDTSLIYDELADEFIVAYYDRGKGELKIATRDANSK